MEVINDSRLPEQPHRKGETNIAGNIDLGIILVAIATLWPEKWSEMNCCAVWGRSVTLTGLSSAANAVAWSATRPINRNANFFINKMFLMSWCLNKFLFSD